MILEIIRCIFGVQLLIFRFLFPLIYLLHIHGGHIFDYFSTYTFPVFRTCMAYYLCYFVLVLPFSFFRLLCSLRLLPCSSARLLALSPPARRARVRARRGWLARAVALEVLELSLNSLLSPKFHPLYWLYQFLARLDHFEFSIVNNRLLFCPHFGRFHCLCCKKTVFS